MKGSSKTVFSGATIEEFGVEIIDIIRNYYPHQDIILVRLFGEKVEHTGVVAGMSGSPVYVDGKLVGALALQFGTFTKEPLAGVTPIEQIFELRNLEKRRDSEASDYGRSGSAYLDCALGAPGSGLGSGLEAIFRQSILSHTRSKRGAPIPAPVTFSGFQTSVISDASDVLRRFGFEVASGGATNSRAFEAGNVSLQPGSAVSQVIIDGDMGIDVSGTVTWCRGDSILAFGHQVFGAGAIRVPMGQTHVLTTIPSLAGSNKMSMVTKIIGTLRQDRLPGVLGVIGEQPPMIPVHITCTTVDGTAHDYFFRAASERRLSPHTPFYLRTAIINAIVTSRLSGSDFSLKVEGEIVLKDFNTVALNNYFSGTRVYGLLAPGDDATVVADYVSSTLASLLVNQFHEPVIEKVSLSVSESAGFSSAEIAEVWCDKKTVSPGDTLTLTAMLHRYHSAERIRIRRSIPIPRNLNAREIMVYVGSASQLQQLERRTNPEKFIARSFSHIVNLLNERRRNDFLYLHASAAQPGLLVGGAELPDLPSSILSVMQTHTATAGGGTANHYFFRESVPLEVDLYGSQIIRLGVEQR